MDYCEAIDYIHRSPKLAKILGNDNLKKVLKEIDSPENSLKFVHIAGTNGKGSTAAMTESVLRESGLRTGMFISPYIERFNERIKLCGEDISDLELTEITERVKKLLEKMDIVLSEFALIFVIALIYFKNHNCDIVVLETGLGGRLDATNAIEKSVVSAITSISFDHMQYLGDSIEKIACEKCGIIKEKGTVVIYPQPELSVLKIAKKTAHDMNANLIVSQKPEGCEGTICYKNAKYKLSLRGEYQLNNAAVCIEIINVLNENGFRISEKDIKNGLQKAAWPGRFEWLTSRILLDGCHNAEGARKFVESAKKINEPLTIVTGVMCDKDYESVAKELSGLTKSIVVTKPDIPRALNPETYKAVFLRFGINATVAEDACSAVRIALGRGGVCAVCGSLYLIGEVRKAFKN